MLSNPAVLWFRSHHHPQRFPPHQLLAEVFQVRSGPKENTPSFGEMLLEGPGWCQTLQFLPVRRPQEADASYCSFDFSKSKYLVYLHIFEAMAPNIDFPLGSIFLKTPVGSELPCAELSEEVAQHHFPTLCSNSFVLNLVNT